MQHDHLQKKNVVLLTPSMGRGSEKGQNICLHAVLCFIPVNLICNMTTFRKEKNDLYTPTLGFKGVCKGKIFNSMLLYASFPLLTKY